jgi:hypothetical protein
MEHRFLVCKSVLRQILAAARARHLSLLITDKHYWIGDVDSLLKVSPWIFRLKPLALSAIRF